MSRRRFKDVALTFVVLSLAAGCGKSSSTPTAPGPSAPAVPSPQAPRAAASLVIEHASIVVRPQPQGSQFAYEPRFQLRETSGKSGATIQNLFVGIPSGGGGNTGPGCWRDALRVLPGATLDTFYTDEGWKWLGYCGVWEGGTSQTPTLQLIVTFTDDAGVTGVVDAIVSATK